MEFFQGDLRDGVDHAAYDVFYCGIRGVASRPRVLGDLLGRSARRRSRTAWSAKRILADGHGARGALGSYVRFLPFVSGPVPSSPPRRPYWPAFLDDPLGAEPPTTRGGAFVRAEGDHALNEDRGLDGFDKS